MISKELLSEVMGCAISNSVDVHGITRVIGIEDEPDGTFLTFGYQSYESSRKRYINIYELAHKCKEWASELEFEISSCTYKATVEYNCRQDEDDDRRLFWKSDYETFSSDTEPEAIFKACQWILDNKDK